MRIPIYQVDAFTNQLFGGNYAAVCLLEEWIDKLLMQQIAAENNLPETAFVVPANGHYEIQWFTPKVPIDLAGHPTLAAAHIIFTELNVLAQHIRFVFEKGELQVKKNGEFYQMNFPARPPMMFEADDKAIEDAIGFVPEFVGQSRDMLIQLSTQQQIENLTPSMQKISRLHPHAVIVTAPGNDCDFVSRFFAPNIGIPEDPVTGSAHCTLIPYWAKVLGKNKLKARQLSQRKGFLLCESLTDRVLIAGQAVSYLKGEITVC